MKITKMTQSKHVSDRWYVQLEDGSRIQVGLGMIAEYSLYTGRELAETELDELRQSAGKNEIKARALRILGARSMSGKEMFDKLVQKGADEHSAAETVAWLVGLGYINDREYAGMVVRHYAAKGYGARRVRDELRRRGIEREIQDEAMAAMPDTDSAVDTLLAKKLGGRAPDRKDIKKAADMLLRRGFSWDEINGALRRYEYEAEEE